MNELGGVHRFDLGGGSGQSETECIAIRTQILVQVGCHCFGQSDRLSHYLVKIMICHLLMSLYPSDFDFFPPF